MHLGNISWAAVVGSIALASAALAVDYDSGGTVNLNTTVGESSTLSNGTTLNIQAGGAITGTLDVTTLYADTGLTATGYYTLNMSDGTITGGNRPITGTASFGGIGLRALGQGHAAVSGGTISGGPGVGGGTGGVGAIFDDDATALISGGDIVGGARTSDPNDSPSNTAIQIVGSANVSITGGNREGLNNTAGALLVYQSAHVTVAGAGGTFTGFQSTAAAIYNDATADISAGTFTGGARGHPVRGGLPGLRASHNAQVMISGGQFNGGDTSQPFIYTGGHAVEFFDQADITITGGTFDGGDSLGFVGGNSLWAYGDAVVKICGGTFNPGAGPENDDAFENAIYANDTATIILTGAPTLNGDIRIEGNAKLQIDGTYTYDGRTLSATFRKDGSTMTATVLLLDDAEVFAAPVEGVPVPASSDRGLALLALLLVGGAVWLQRRRVCS